MAKKEKAIIHLIICKRSWASGLNVLYRLHLAQKCIWSNRIEYSFEEMRCGGTEMQSYTEWGYRVLRGCSLLTLYTGYDERRAIWEPEAELGRLLLVHRL